MPLNALIKLEIAPDLVERVYSALLDAISEGRLKPGARITQEEVAEQLSVSRQPVLQAIRLLKNDGFVQDAPGRGVLVAPLNADWFAHVYAVRGALDALAAKLAANNAAKHSSRPTTEKIAVGVEFNAFSDLIVRGKAAAKRQQIDQLISLDIEFHNAIYKASDNPLIEQSAALHWRHIKRAMGAVLQSNATRDSVWIEHEAIAKAISAGDAQKAETLMRGHGDRASKNLILQINSLLTTQADK
jgi:DNA-binding GntR family transcriptional regulator